MSAEIDLFTLVRDGVENDLNQRLKEDSRRKQASAALMQWLAVKARKKQVPDISTRLNRVEKRVQKLVNSMTFEVSNDKLVIKSAGSDEETLKWFRLGSNWFEANPVLVETILSGLFNK